jgi:hypothetical protein
LEDRLNQLDKIAKEYKKFKAAYPAQEAEPQDSKERLALGRYCAFIKEDWTKGLPLLAASNDAFLAEPARKDLLARQSAAKAADAGETWLALAEQEKGIAKTNLQKRAKHCFVVAYSLLPDAHKSNVTEPLKLRHGDSYLRPGLQGEFFQGGRLIKQRVDPQLRFRDGFASVDPDLTNSAFTAKWKGYLWLAQPQQLNFGVQCTGAFDIRLDNQRLLSSTKEKISISTSRFLLDGLHTVEIIYQNNGGDAAFELTTTTFGNRFAPAEREPPLFYHRPKKKTP